MAQVTLPGGVSGSTQTITFNSSSTIALATTIQNAIGNLPPAAITVVTGTSFIQASGESGIVVNPTQPTAVTAGFSADVVANAAGLTFTAGTGTNDLIAIAGGNNNISFGAFTTFNVATGDGNNLVNAPGADSAGTITAGAGTNTIEGANASSSSVLVLAQGSHDLVALGVGAATVGEKGSAAIIYGGSGPELLADGGANDTIVAGSGPVTMYGGSNGLYFLSSRTSTFVGSSQPAGSDTLVGVTGASETVFGGTSDLIYTGNSNLLLVGGSGSSTVVGGGGTAALFGTPGSDINLFAGSGGVAMAAGAGAETLNAGGSTSPALLVAGSGNASVIGGSGPTTIFGGTGNNTLTGGAGANLYAFVNGGSSGTDTITDFKESAAPGAPNDLVVLLGYGANEVANALSTAVTTAGGTTITLADNTKISFLGIAKLNPGNIVGF